MSASADLLAGRAARGAFWALLATLLVRLVSVASLAVLARLLVPEEFGLAAFALVFITYAETAADLGAAAALIYWPERRAEAARAAFWINLVMSGFWLGATLLVAPAVAAFFHHPEAAPLLRLLAWSFPLKALANTHDALCQKELRFRQRLVPEVAMAGGKGVASVLFAVAGLGVWSLAWGQLAGLAARAVALWWIEPWRPVGPLPRDLVRPLLRFGRGAVAVNVLAVLLHHADLVVVGRLLGPAALGLYQVATKLPEMTVALLIWVSAKVLFPTLSKLQAEPRELRRLYLGSLDTIALLALPATVAMLFLAPSLAVALFGERWAGAAPILQALAVYTGLRALGSPAGDVLKALGRPGLLARLGLFKVALLLPALWWAGHESAVAVALTMAVVTAATSALNLAVGCRITGASLRDLAAALSPNLLPAAALAAVLSLWRAATTTGGIGPLGASLGGLLLAGATFAVVLRATRPELLQRARSLLAAPREQWSGGTLPAEAEAP